MSKVILTEERLVEILNKVITEELSSAVNENFFWNVAKNTAGLAAKSVLTPFGAAEGLLSKAYDFINGDFNVNGGRNNNRYIYSRGNRARNNPSAVAAAQTPVTRADIERHYGVPETIGTSKKKLFPKTEMSITLNDEEYPLGKHFLEQNQDGNSETVWKSKVTSAERALERLRGQKNEKRQTTKVLKNIMVWLKGRDRAYLDYVKIKN